MSVCACGLAKAHYRCLSCGSHSLLDSVPCWHCRYFKFETIEAPTISASATVVEQAVQPVTPPVAAPKTKRRPRGVADTQRD